MFRIGDKVLIHGDYGDFTDHLDGLVGEVVRVGWDDCEVVVDHPDYPDTTWMIWNINMTPIVLVGGDCDS